MWSSLNVAAVLGVCVVLYKLGEHWVFKLAVRHLTVVNDLSLLGRCREPGDRLKGTAVICGGSIAGLLAARVCADHFEDVLVLDPDNDGLVERALAAVPQGIDGNADSRMGSAPRARVMQNRMIHATQVLNLRALERMFPNFRAWVHCVGGVIGPADGTYLFNGLPLPSIDLFTRGASEWDVFSLSRGAYETLLRALVLRGIKNVRHVQGTVMSLQRTSSGCSKIGGVVYRAANGQSVQVPAELVIDCTGAAHVGSTWLRRAGFEPPRKETYHPHMRYATTEFTIDPQALEKIVPGGKRPYPLLNISRERGEGKVIVMSWVEHDRIHLNLGGWGFKGNISTVDEMRTFTEEMQKRHDVPRWLFDLYDYLEGTPSETATTQVVSAGSLYHIMYHNNSKSLPSNFVALGDAQMKINPLGGQGLAKAMVGAITLDACLRKKCADGCPDAFATHFFHQLAKKLGSTWTGKKYADYAFDTTEPSTGETLHSGARMRAFQNRVLQLELGGDQDIARRRFEMMHWMAPPVVLFAPSVLRKVVWIVVKEWFSSWKTLWR